MDPEPKDGTQNIPAPEPASAPASVSVFAPAPVPAVNPFFTRGCCEIPKLYHKNDKVFQHNCSKFDTHDWLNDLPLPVGFKVIDLVEVQFKNNRKDFFRLPSD